MSFQKIYDYLSQASNLNLDDLTGFESCQQRLLNALENSTAQLGIGDTVALIRHVLRHEAELQGGVSPTIKVPRTLPFPTHRKVWELSSMDVLTEKPDFFVLSARPWKPEWLSDSETASPEPPLSENKAKRRNNSSVIGDPFLSLLGHETYQSVGQREAVRAILTSPPGATLVVNLPTGSGKSLCAHLPAQLRSDPVGVTIVVVPTVALAIDQERAFREKTGISYATAYYSDNSIDGQERRDEIRDRIRQGTQSIIFTSPEGLIESLSPSVYQAARQEFLRYFIIDEAHIVEQWGDEFRPEFQELAGFRRDLLRLTSFPTLLLTATVTESCLDTLETLFGQPGTFQVVSSVQLRPEPAYWFAWCSSWEERRQRLIEALHNLPRPLIIYGSKVADVDRWYSELQRAGFKRIAKMTGKSKQQDRWQLLEAWRNRQIDVVVATSAFGLGVDLPDVRAVIHVCIPETIDRFYQEVGRGGRDGKATLSLTLYTQSDYDVAFNLNEITYISSEKGRSRWEEMFARKSRLPDGRFQVPINVLPSYNLDLDPSSTGNQDWNIRTLTLMSRAGLLEIDAEPPPQRTNFDSEEAYKKALEHHRSLRTVKILNDAHLSPETWNQFVEPARSQRQWWAERTLKLMREALRPQQCISEIFSETYSIPARESPYRNRVHVERSCGGCPVCRAQGVEPFAGGIPLPAPVWDKPSFCLDEPLQKLLDGESLLLVFYSAFEDKRSERNRDRLFKWLINQGIQNVVAPTALHKAFTKQSGKNVIFLFEEYRPLQMFKVPTLIFHAEGKPLSVRYLLAPEMGVPRIILLPENTPDPTANHRQLKDVFNGRNFYFEFLCGELGL
ncbi:protein DpdF [Leptolyngbya sp. FACHB-261]|uniref:protein DpdF n=1 Tax=Leptolyngbya sp. FACHB-261 TaxID=2692806 RepID=UPI001682CBF1|nr:protein DpdF [Leptolyngbya sp. FACHB-261]MBD2101020.1 ATP-dependent DNA helicase RecQ [Leptolyngbya sp. FACHB-261]